MIVIRLDVTVVRLGVLNVCQLWVVLWFYVRFDVVLGVLVSRFGVLGWVSYVSILAFSVLLFLGLVF